MKNQVKKNDFFILLIAIFVAAFAVVLYDFSIKEKKQKVTAPPARVECPPRTCPTCPACPKIPARPRCVKLECLSNEANIAGECKQLDENWIKIKNKAQK